MSYSKVNGNLVHMQAWEVTLKSEGLSVKGSVSVYPVSSVTDKHSSAFQVADFHETSGISQCPWPSTRSKIHTYPCLKKGPLNRVEAQCH